MTQVRLVAVDMDGTFLDDSMGYDRPRFAALHDRLAALGIRFVVASGNQYYQLRSYFPDHPDILFVAENGALLADATDTELRMCPIPRDVAAATWHALARWPDLHVIVCGRRSAYVLTSADPLAVAVTRLYYTRLTIVDSFDAVDEEVVKLALGCPPAQTDEIMTVLAEQLPAEAIVPTSSGHGSIDLIPRGVNKGDALAWLGDHLGIPTESMVAFGDGGNDVEMLRTVGFGVAMAQAPDAVRAHADVIAGSNNDAGVLAYLEEALPAWEEGSGASGSWVRRCAPPALRAGPG